MALEDGEWEKADAFFEHALNRYAECSEAYFGKILASMECSAIQEMIEKRQNAEPLTPLSVPALEEDSDRIAAAVYQYRVPNYLEEETIRQQFRGFDFNYPSLAAAIEKRLKEEEDYFQNDGLMGRAMRYAQGDFAATLKKIRSQLIFPLQESLQRARENETQTIAALAEQYAAHLEQAEQAAAALSKQAQEKKATDYAAARADMEQNPSELKLLSNAERLDLPDGYKDGEALAKQCRSEKTHLEEECQKWQKNEQISRPEEQKKQARMKKLKFAAIPAAVALILWTVTGILSSSVRPAACATISNGFSYTAAVKADGTVICNDSFSSKDSTENWSDISAIATGILFIADLKEDGSVVTTGVDISGIFDAADDWLNITALSAGIEHLVGLKEDGTVVAAGNNEFDQCDVSDWSGITAISAGDICTAGLKSDGTVVATGRNTFEECDVEKWHDIIAISAGYFSTFGIKSDGTAIAVGNNENGQCGVEEWRDILIPD